MTIDGDTRLWLKSEHGVAVPENSSINAFCSYVMQRSSLVQVHDARIDVRFSENSILPQDTSVAFYAGFPLKSPDGHAVGALCVFDQQPRVLTQAQQDALRDLVGIVQNQFALGVLANRDVLTGLHNRRFFDECLYSEWRRQMRLAVPISVLLFDVDNFKNYNDEFGHPQGDRCLKRIADAAAKQFSRAGDFLARYGGEEFVVLLSGTDEAGAQHKAEQLRLAIEDLAIENADDADTAVVTVSVGGATMTPKRDVKSSLLVKRADKALYEAKNHGRNQVWWDEAS